MALNFISGQVDGYKWFPSHTHTHTHTKMHALILSRLYTFSFLINYISTMNCDEQHMKHMFKCLYTKYKLD